MVNGESQMSISWVGREYVLLSLLSLTAVAGLQTVGIILVVAMLVTPGATAYLLSDNFDHMMLIANCNGFWRIFKCDGDLYQLSH